MNLDIIQYACVLITSMMRFAGIVQSCLSKMPFSDSEPWPALQGEPESRHLRAHKSDTTFHQVSIQTKHHCMILSSCHHLCLLIRNTHFIIGEPKCNQSRKSHILCPNLSPSYLWVETHVETCQKDYVAISIIYFFGQKNLKNLKRVAYPGRWLSPGNWGITNVCD